MRHFVESGATNQCLCCLRFKQTCREVVAEDGFQAKHGGLRQGTDMIARILLPCLASVFTNGAQILVSFETLGFGVAVFPDARILARWDQDLHIR